MEKKFVDIMILDNAAEDAENFFQMIKEKYNTDVQASIIMLLVHLISENSNIPIDDLWASLVVLLRQQTVLIKSMKGGKRKKHDKDSTNNTLLSRQRA